MAKATPPGAERNLIKFRCLQCGTTLKVPLAQGGRYIECPKCKGKTQVPKNQKDADEEYKNYDVNKMAYDVTGECRNCGAKMSKKAVLCTKCGYDYRSGKNLEVVDKTKLPSDYPTWNKILAGLGAETAVNATIRVMSAILVSAVAIAALGFGIMFVIMWFVANEFDRPPIWPWYVTLGVTIITSLIMFGMIQEALVEAASRPLYGRAISAGSAPVAALYFLAIAVPAYALATLAICFLVFHISGPTGELPPGVERGIINQGPLPTFTWNAESGVVGIVAAAFLTAIGHIYFFFGIATFAADLSVNPVTIFQWIGKCIADVFPWLGLTMLLSIVAIGLPSAVLYFGITMEIYPTWVYLGWAFLQAFLFSYMVAAAAQMAGQIIKRHL